LIERGAIASIELGDEGFSGNHFVSVTGFGSRRT
jgi:hypothetical protein